MPGQSRYSVQSSPDDEGRTRWVKPTGNPSDPPPEQGKVQATLQRPGRGDDPGTEVHLAQMTHPSGAGYGRAQEWKRDAQGRAWPVPKGGITIRFGEIPAWRTYLDWLEDQLRTLRGSR